MPLVSRKKLAACAAAALAIGSAHAAAYFPSADSAPQQTPQPRRKSLRELRLEMYGGQDHLHPTANSALGQYLQATGAKTLARSFLTAPIGSVNPPSLLGPQKLVVAVSQETFAAFKEKFSSQNYLYIYHKPNDSTLEIAFEGQQGNPVYTRRMQPVRFYSPGTMMIPILLDSDEGQRVATYIKASLNPALKYQTDGPWNLKTRIGTLYSSGMAPEFHGCTHWFGNLPIGNSTVDSYYFPSGVADPEGRNPMTKRLEEYEDPVGMTPENVAIVRQIWTVPGHQQLGEMLAPASNRRGEFTNVGWAATTLLGAIGVDRVPVVFLFTRDEKAEIPAEFPLHIQAH